MLSDLNSETRFGILLSLHNFLTTIYKDLLISIFFDSHSNFQNFSHFGADQIEHFWENRLYHVYQREKTHQNKEHTWKIKKVEKWRALLYNVCSDFENPPIHEI